ncbi:enoyl-CoA hydratase/isomerase [Sorangium sp. So ce136]|uniref:enoyl-CoA hydratase/isomerase n=1 Tax=Sorangium sp. So ce136 TaxID=3133284 RepID=UPI003F090974
MEYQTVRVRFQESICFLQLHRPEANNAINDRLVEECRHVLSICERSATVVVLEGLPEVFCTGADFQELREHHERGGAIQSPEPLYDLWLQLATGPYISIAHVRGKVNAGGVGFVAACDVVIADDTAQFSLSELLFGLMPACVMPFLVRRAGFQKAHYMALMTRPVPVQQALEWGLVDAHAANSASALHMHLLRLRNLSKVAIARYKRYMHALSQELQQAKQGALAAATEVFSDPGNLEGIFRYMATGQLPWQR